MLQINNYEKCSKLSVGEIEQIKSFFENHQEILFFVDKINKHKYTGQNFAY